MPALHLRELEPGTRFMLCRTKQKFTYVGYVKSPSGGWLTHVVIREFGDSRKTTLHHSSHVKPVVRVVTSPCVNDDKNPILQGFPDSRPS